MTESDAERLMRAHRYAEAIAVFESRLADDPSDLGAMLRMGLCHLLNRSEPAFLAIHDRATAVIHELGAAPRQTEQLWVHYQRLFKLVTATALVVGGMANLIACEDLVSSGHKYSGGVYHDPGAPVGGAANATDASAPDGDAAMDVVSAPDGAAPDGDAGADAAADATSAHRYSGGVYLDAADG
jgi:hypothetical protein